MSKPLLAVALVAGLAAAAVAADAPKMQLLSFTGQIQIKVGNEVIGVVPGGKMPDIPAGAEIIVVSGEAVLQAGNTVVKANSGDSFSFNTSAAGGVQIAATGDKTNLTVTVGGTEAKVGTGDKIEVAASAGGKSEIKVVAGTVEVTTAGQTTSVGKGGTASASTPTPPAAITSAQQTQQKQTTPTATTPEPTTTADSGTGSLPPAPPPPNPSANIFGTTRTVSPSSP